MTPAKAFRGLVSNVVIFGGWKIRLLEERTRCPVAAAGSRAGLGRRGAGGEAGGKADLTGGICRQLGQKRTSPSFGPPPPLHPIRGRRNVHVSLSGFPNDSSAFFLPDTLGTKPQWWLNPTSAPPGDLFFLKCSISHESEGPPPFGKATRWKYFYALSAVGERESWLKIEPVMPSNPVGLGQRQSWDTTHLWEYNSLCSPGLSSSSVCPSTWMHTGMRTCASIHSVICAHTHTHMRVHAHKHMQAHKRTRAHMSPHIYTCQHACTYRQTCTTSLGACWLSLCHGRLVQFKNYSEC